MFISLTIIKILIIIKFHEGNNLLLVFLHFIILSKNYFETEKDTPRCSTPKTINNYLFLLILAHTSAHIRGLCGISKYEGRDRTAIG